MNDSSSSRSGKIPSDEQMDGLLRDFFSLEMPVGLNQPFRRASLQNPVAVSLVAMPSETVASVPRSRRLIVSSAIAVLAMSLVLAVTMDGGGSPSSGTPSVSEKKTAPAEKTEDLMLVSPQGDARSIARPVGDDGVTLEETDGIELKPRN